jgi:hypothetical protein
VEVLNLWRVFSDEDECIIKLTSISVVVENLAASTIYLNFLFIYWWNGEVFMYCGCGDQSHRSTAVNRVA